MKNCNNIQLSIIVPCYNGQRMLNYQIEHWKRLNSWVLHNIEFIVIDDGSNYPISIDNINLNLTLARINEDILWNVAGARNLGAKLSKSPWLLFIDLDRMITITMLEFCLKKSKENDPSKYHLFSQQLPTGKIIPKKPEGTHLVSAEVFWKVGGNDEDFSGSYGYQAQYFLKKLKFLGIQKIKNNDIFIVQYENFKDASCDLSKDLSINKKLYRQKMTTKDLPQDFTGIRFSWSTINKWTL